MHHTKYKVYQFENFILDQNKKQLFVGRKEIFLTFKNFEILSLLVENSDSIVEKKEIFEIIWSDNFVGENNLPVYISALRKVFKEHGSTKELIKTISGRGYCFTAPVQQILPIESKLFNKNNEENIAAQEEANNFCLKGQYILDTISTRAKHESDLNQAIDFFNSAIKLNPNFIEAYLGNSYAIFFLHNLGYLSKEEAFSKCRILLKQGRLSNPNKSENFFMDGLINLVFEFNIPQASKLLHKAIELNPNNAIAIYWLGILNMLIDNLETSRLCFIRASEIDPTNINFRNGLIRIHYCSQEFNRAIEEAKDILKMDGRSFGAHFLLSLSYARIGIFDEALKYCNDLLTYIDNFEIRLLHSYIYVLMGQPEQANQLAEEILLEEERIYNHLFYIVLIYTAQNRLDEAFDLMLKYVDKSNLDILFIKSEPGLKVLQDDERLQIILEKLTLN